MSEKISVSQKRFRALMHSNFAGIRTVLLREYKFCMSKRRYGHVLSEAAHYLNRAAEKRREGKLAEAKSYVKGARSILLNGTRWSVQTNEPRPKLP